MNDALDDLIRENAEARRAERAAEDEAHRIAGRIADPERAAQEDREDAALRQRLDRLGVSFTEPAGSDDG